MFSNSKKEFSSLFLVLACLFVSCLLISNIIAGKLIMIKGMVLPAAVILFPITYILGDVITEVYGFKAARTVIWTGFACNFLMAVMFTLTIILPHPLFWDQQQAFKDVLGFTPRLVIASLIGYLFGELANSSVLSWMKVLTRGRWLWSRTIGSTLIGEGMDTLLFITIAFYGMFPTTTILSMIAAQYFWKVGYETIATPLTYLVVGWTKQVEDQDTFDSITYSMISNGGRK